MTAPVSSLILVRHCEAAGQDPDAALTAAGRRQAQELAGFLSVFPIDAIVTSAYRRARETAEPAADFLNVGIETDPRLNERVLSPHPIDHWREIVRDSFADPDLRVAGGESANDVLERAWPALDELLSGSARLPVVVTHGNLLALVLHSIDDGFGYAGWESLSNPDVFRVRIKGGELDEFLSVVGPVAQPLIGPVVARFIVTRSEVTRRFRCPGDANYPDEIATLRSQ